MAKLIALLEDVALIKTTLVKFRTPTVAVDQFLTKILSVPSFESPFFAIREELQQYQILGVYVCWVNFHVACSGP